MWRKLAVHRRENDTCRAEWARSLGNLAGCLGAFGRLGEAIEKAKTSELIWGDLAGHQPDVYRADWAGSITNLATHLSEAGRFDEALEKGQTAELILRELATLQPDSYRADWAMSIGNLANRLSDLGRFDEAIEKAQSSEVMWCELAGSQPDAHRADWARSLENLGIHLGAVARCEEAVERVEVAKAMWRNLADLQPDAYRAELAWSLGNLAIHLSVLGRFAESVEAAQAAEVMCRDLAERQPNAYRVYWAWVLSVFAKSKLNGRDFPAAVTTAGKAIDQFQLLEPERMRSRASWVGWAHRVYAAALKRCQSQNIAPHNTRIPGRVRLRRSANHRRFGECNACASQADAHHHKSCIVVSSVSASFKRRLEFRWRRNVDGDDHHPVAHSPADDVNRSATVRSAATAIPVSPSG